MALTLEQWKDLARLVHRAKTQRLTMDEEARMRYLVSRNRPEADRLRWPELLREARIQIGILWLKQ